MVREWIVEEREDGLHAALRIANDDGSLVQLPWKKATETSIRTNIAGVGNKIVEILQTRDAAYEAANAELAKWRIEEDDLRQLLARLPLEGG